MTRVLFICHGNICRSPTAEFVFKDMAAKAGLADRFCIASAATTDEEIINGVGNPVYPPAKAELARHGLGCEGKCAVQLRRDDYEKYDLFLCMDSANVKNSIRILGGDPQGKVKKLLSYTGSNRDVSDPWFTGEFVTAYNDIYSGCAALFKALTAEN